MAYTAAWRWAADAARRGAAGDRKFNLPNASERQISLFHNPSSSKIVLFYPYAELWLYSELSCTLLLCSALLYLAYRAVIFFTNTCIHTVQVRVYRCPRRRPFSLLYANCSALLCASFMQLLTDSLRDAMRCDAWKQWRDDGCCCC